MSLFVTLFADLLVAVLLAATIVTSLRLSRRIGQLKGDETALKQTIGDLMVATASAERAIAGLRGAIDECDRTLDARIEAAGVRAAELAAHVDAGAEVVARIGSIVAQMRSAPIRTEPAAAPRPKPEVEVPVARRPEPAATRPAEPQSPNGERLGAAAAAALAMTERALARVRARAA